MQKWKRKIEPIHILCFCLLTGSLLHCQNEALFLFGGSDVPSLAPLVPRIVFPRSNEGVIDPPTVQFHSSSFISPILSHPYTSDDDTVLLVHFEDDERELIVGSSVSSLEGMGFSGTSIIADGKFGQALNTNGFTSGFVSFADDPVLDLEGPLTVEAWVRPKALADHFGSRNVVSKSSWTLPGEVDQRSFQLGLESLQPFFHISTDGMEGAGHESLNVVTEIEPIPVGVWSKIRAAYDGTRVTIFLNGVEVYEKDVSGDLNDPLLHSGNADLLIGAANGGITFNNFIGDIDEVRISSSIREEDENLSGASHHSSDWQILNFNQNEVVWQSLNDEENLYFIQLSQGEYVGSLFGVGQLQPDQDYFVQVRYRDSLGQTSFWSPAVNFHTRLGLPDVSDYEPVTPGTMEIEVLDYGLESPTRIKVSPDGSLLMVGQLPGTILLYQRIGNDWVRQTNPFYDLGDLNVSGERGLTAFFWGHGFDPASGDSMDRDVFITYQILVGDQYLNRITRVTLDTSGMEYVGTSPILIYEGPQTSSSAHQIQDGIGVLYEGSAHFLLSIGDAFVPPDALDPDKEGRGKLLLMQRDGSDPLGTRPYPSSPKVQALGIRNTYGIAMAPTAYDPRRRVLGAENGNNNNDRIWFLEALDFGHEEDEAVSLGYTGSDLDSSWTAVEDVNYPGVSKPEAVLSLISPPISPNSVAFHSGKGIIPDSDTTQLSFLVSYLVDPFIVLGIIDDLDQFQPSLTLTPIINRKDSLASTFGNPLGLEVDPINGDIIFSDVVTGELSRAVLVD